MIIESEIVKAFLKKDKFSEEEIGMLVDEIMLGRATYQCYSEETKERMSEINIVDALFYSNRGEVAIDLLERALMINETASYKDGFLFMVMETAFRHGKYDLLVNAFKRSSYEAQHLCLINTKFTNLNFADTKKVLEELIEKQDKKIAEKLMCWLPEIIVRGRNRWEFGDEKIECLIEYAKRVENVKECGLAFKNSYSRLMSQTKDVLMVFKKCLNGSEAKVKNFWMEISDALRVEVLSYLTSGRIEYEEKIKEINEIRATLKEVDIIKIPFSVFVDSVIDGVKKIKSRSSSHDNEISDEKVVNYYLEFLGVVDHKKDVLLADHQKKRIELLFEKDRRVVEKILLALQVVAVKKTKLSKSL